MPNPNQSSARKAIEEALSRIQQKPQATARKRFLQQWDFSSDELSFLCQNGTDAVEVGTRRCKKIAVVPGLLSGFRAQAVQNYRSGHRAESLRIHAELTNALRKYVRFADARIYDLVAVWIMGTYMYSAFTHYGYLYFHSKQKRSGKTRCLEVISLFAFQASPVMTAPTPAALRETAADGSTLVLDTVERWKRKNYESFSAAMELLDAGFKNGSTVALMKPTGMGGYEKKLIPVYAPYALAGIGDKALSDTAIDRAFPIEMKRKRERDTVARFREDEARLRYRELIDDLYIWALGNAPTIVKIYNDALFDAKINSIGLNDRALDIWLPILAICKTVSQDVFQRLQSLAADMGIESPERIQEAQELLLLEGMVAECAKRGTKWRAMTSEIEALAASQGLALNTSTIHELLEGIAEQKQTRLPNAHGEPRRAWHLDKAALEGAIADRQPDETEDMG